MSAEFDGTQANAWVEYCAAVLLLGGISYVWLRMKFLEIQKRRILEQQQRFLGMEDGSVVDGEIKE